MAISVPSRLLFIDGEWREPVLKKRIPIINPATEEIIGDIPAATAEDVELAVDAARRALARNSGKDWASAPGAHRAKYLRAIAAKVTERKPELAKLEAMDCGKPLEEAVWDMDDVAGCFEYYADLAEGLDAKQNASVAIPMDTFKSYVRKEPIGVVGLITPWNYPMLMATWKVAPALAAGCAAVLKPSELASVTCLELADVCREVGLPAGVLNILTRLGPEAGGPLAVHPHVDKYEKILKFIETAKSEGATVQSGGERPEHLKKGFFVEPTIITDVNQSMHIWREEVFGLGANSWSIFRVSSSLTRVTSVILYGMLTCTFDPSKFELLIGAILYLV